MEYEKTVRVSGDIVQAVRVVAKTLTRHGFQIVKKRESSARLLASEMGRSRSSPLGGASVVCLTGRSGRLTIEAEFGGLQRRMRIATGIVLGVAVLLIVLFRCLFPSESLAVRCLESFGPLAPCPVLLLLIERHFMRRSVRAMDVLLENAATLSENG
ncbi:MAG: hypothetical protein HQ582_17925 [Planctomycetes bacterium]|nr:hypothetical protein [Planctomycetota bacterium]